MMTVTIQFKNKDVIKFDLGCLFSLTSLENEEFAHNTEILLKKVT